MVSGTVAQWECVWGKSYGDLLLLAVVVCQLVFVCVLLILIGNNERQLLLLIIGSLMHVIHRVGVFEQQTKGVLKTTLFLEEAMLSIHTAST